MTIPEEARVDKSKGRRAGMVVEAIVFAAARAWRRARSEPGPVGSLALPATPARGK